MTNKGVMAFALMAFLLPFASEAARRSQTNRVDINASDFKPADSCSADQVLAEGSGEECNEGCLQKHFDKYRKEYDIVSSGEAAADASKCTQQDICLLMRQLDYDFFRRARLGALTDAEAETSLTQGWVHSGNCNKQFHTRGFRMTPVRSIAMCKRALRQKGFRPAKKFVVHQANLPAGCVAIDLNGKKYGRLNELDSDVDPFIKYKKSRRIEITQYCEQDRSLDEAAALYYSPYKLKDSMRKRTEYSTSCSFGMMAHLSNTGATKSPCAKILAYRPPAEFEHLQAKDALDMAKKLDGQGHAAKAADLRDFADAMRSKNTLMDIVANRWCGGVWDGALQSSDSTCSLPRSPKWAKVEKNQPAAMWRQPKTALTEEACADLAGGETLADILEDVSEEPPDFFRDSDV